ncbi:hypothetical protein FRC10_006881 [Ceratobasidium sp. 414]|nr:hypothetical protein FRC10_006881 [Ceratobasidium sp. 414]
MAPIPLELEVRDHIFCDPLFIERFLSVGDKDKLKTVLQLCHKSPTYNKQRRKWTIPRSRQEARLYQPIQRILNTIKVAVETTTGRTSATTFLNRAGRPINADCELNPLTRPDLVLFDGALEHNEHWETIHMTVSVKRLKSHLKAAIAGLAFDARAVFTHQLHRRHLYALAICGSEATFVRFDRAGVLYSTPIDVCADSDQFTKAVAALLMMDDEEFGLDTAFSTVMNESRRLDYYVNFPGSVLDDQPSDRNSARSPTRKFKVVERLCHRMDVIGRATIVLRIRLVKLPETEAPGIKTRGQKRAFEESQPEELHDESYVLKLIWRDPSQESEGDILEELVGIYGVVQCIWHCDVYWPNKSGRSAKSGGMHADETAQVEDMLVCKDLTTIENAVYMTGNGDEYECSVVNTKKLEPTSETRMRRVYSRVLMSSVGKSLWAAESPRELLTGVLDAMMGCWRLVNMGIIHRDISGGNVMLLSPGQHFRRREWKEPVETSEPLSESETKLREYLARFDRDPTGILSDFDMYMQLSDSESSGSVKSESPDSTSGDITQRLRSACAPEPEDVRAENDPPHSKRRRTEATYVPVPSPNSAPARVHRAPLRMIFNPTPSSEMVDYRVGTVTFMSIGVLGVLPGERYEHTFMDDLESFLWVLLYVIAGHANPGVNSLNSAALKILDHMDHEDTGLVQMFKSGFLANCGSYPEGAAGVLRATGNDWACDDNLVSAVVQLGSFFLDDEDVSIAELAPAVAFPKVIDIILGALEKM